MKNKGILILIAAAILLGGWLIYNRYRVVIPPVDITKSEIGWTGKSISDAHTGKLKLTKAELRFQNGALKGGSFEADMRSITVTDISDTTDNRHFIEHIANEDFFEVDKFPTASFTITATEQIAADRCRVTGTMKIKDREQPITFDADVTPVAGGKRLSALVNIDRTLFGIEYGAKGKPGSEKDWFILNEFTLNINVVAGE